MRHRGPAIPPETIAADPGNALILLSTRTGRARAIPSGAGDNLRADTGTAEPVQVATALPSWGTAEAPACLTAIAAPRLAADDPARRRRNPSRDRCIRR